MITTYKEYLGQTKSLTFEEMNELQSKIISDITGDEEAVELYDELLEAAKKYSSFRAEWLLIDRQKKMDIDPSRTSAHNSVITHLNMLQRYLKMQGKAAAWRDELGFEDDDPYNRKKIGDFACFLTFINSINAR